MSPEVSVLIPAFNSVDILPATIEAILSQELPPSEVIVVDDGSTEDMQKAISPFGERVLYHRTENGGICRARNAAASLATSPFLAFCDHDDLWRKDKLAKQMALHAQNQHLEYSFTNFSLVVGDTWAERTKLDDAPTQFFGAEDSHSDAFECDHSLYEQLLEFQPIWPSTIVITKAFFNRLGGFREEFGKNPSEDLEFTLRCVQSGPIGVVREPVVGVRRHCFNYSGNNYRNTLGQIEVLEFALENHSLSECTKAKVRRQITLRRIEASYEAFRLQDFDKVAALLHNLPNSSLDHKARMKKWISRMPTKVARLLHSKLST